MNTFQLENINPLRYLTEGAFCSLLDAATRGDYARLQWTYFHAEKRNPFLRAVKRRLISALGKLDWDIKIADVGEDPEKKAMAEKQAQTLRSAYDAVANLRNALNFLALTELRGFSHLEKIYSPDWTITELRIVEQWFWTKAGFYGAWKYNAEAREGVNQGEAIDATNFIIRTVDDPVDEIAVREHIRMETSDSDWEEFLFDYGIPKQIIEGPPNVPKELEPEYKRQAENISSNARGYIPNGAKVHTLETSTGTGTFKDRLDHLAELIIIAGTSGKLTILTESGSGTLAGGAQADAFDDIAASIAGEISGTMQAQFDQAILERLHLGEPVLAYFEIAAEDEEDRSQVLTDAKIAKDAGYEMDAADLSERTSYKLTKIEEKVESGKLKAEEVPAAPPIEEPPIAPAAIPIPIPESLADSLEVTPEFLSPAQSVFDDLLASAGDGAITTAELMAAAQTLLDTLPDLAMQSDVTGIATALQSAVEASVASTIRIV